MEGEYVQEYGKSYLILKAMEAGKDFEEEMIGMNRITGILRFYKRQEDEKLEYLYDITGKKPLASVMENKKFQGRQLCILLLSINRIVERAKEYLLDSGQFVFLPEYLYIKEESMEELFLCYYPGYGGNLMEGIQELLRYVLTKLDHDEKETMMLGYELYRTSMEENIGMENLMKIAACWMEDKKELKAEQKEAENIAEERLRPQKGRNDLIVSFAAVFIIVAVVSVLLFILIFQRMAWRKAVLIAGAIFFLTMGILLRFTKAPSSFLWKRKDS